MAAVTPTSIIVSSRPAPVYRVPAMSLDRDLATLNALAQALSGSLDLEQVLHTALDKVAELLALDTGWVWLLEEGTGESRLAAARDLPPGLVEHP